MRKFEYKTVAYFSMANNLLETLNKLGAEGWELVSISGGTCIFKRKLKKKKKVQKDLGEL